MHWREVAMKQIEKILAPTDLSESSLPGLRYALDLGKTVGASVTVLRVFDSYHEFLHELKRIRAQAARDPALCVPDPYLPFYEFTNIAGLNDELECRTALRRFLETHFSGLPACVRIREKVVVGKADKTIVEEAKKESAGLIVMSARERTRFAHWFTGSMTQTIARAAPCPVLSIRAEAEKKTEKDLAAAQPISRAPFGDYPRRDRVPHPFGLERLAASGCATKGAFS
jgi:nucleotide-binding universal stress UspA family protein